MQVLLLLAINHLIACVWFLLADSNEDGARITNECMRAVWVNPFSPMIKEDFFGSWNFTS